ncbi:hypothetical protein ACRALDRAFT_2025187 [Sodiomyces alcalophilus JCM 7366]|uniref:uncharacterized protein n=1 Tax=Sodiomyces alcalophilus JCM 7366 TaxID=591952 RepID=UPI0039B5D553
MKTTTTYGVDSHPAPTSFPFFPHLPLEIQDMIWEISVASAPPRVFEWRTDLAQSDRYPGEWCHTTACHPPPPSRHPVIQQVCRRARYAAKRAGLRSLRLPPPKCVPAGLPLGDDAVRSRGTKMWYHRPLPAEAFPRHDVPPLFNVERDIILLQDSWLLLTIPGAMSTTTRSRFADNVFRGKTKTHAAGPSEEAEPLSLPAMATGEARNVAFEVQTHFETWDDMYWSCVLLHLRRTFPHMRTLSLVLLEHDKNGVDVITEWPRNSPWVRDGSGAASEGLETRAAPITELVPVRHGVRTKEAWDEFSARMERLRREIPGCEGLTIVMRLAERDWTPARKPLSGRTTMMPADQPGRRLSTQQRGWCAWEPQSSWILGRRIEVPAR